MVAAPKNNLTKRAYRKSKKEKPVLDNTKLEKKKKRVFQCKICGKPGHMAKTCPSYSHAGKNVEEPRPLPSQEEVGDANHQTASEDNTEGLTAQQKKEILEKFNEGLPPSTNTPTLAKEYKVSIKAIWAVIKNRPKK